MHCVLQFRVLHFRLGAEQAADRFNRFLWRKYLLLRHKLVLLDQLEVQVVADDAQESVELTGDHFNDSRSLLC